MMFARLSLIALCAVAALASGAAANPTGEPTAEVCIGRLAESIKDVPVPQEVNELLAKVEADLPYEAHEWDELEEEVSAKYSSYYPTAICRKFLEDMNAKFLPVVEEGCSKRLEETDFGELARTKPTAEVTAVYAAVKANNACIAFEPIPAEQEQAI